MGTGSASGDDRALEAIRQAVESPLLNSSDITGAKSILLNISTGTGENELTMDELGEITGFLYDAASDDALIIRGISKDESQGEEISVTVIATGFEPNSILEPYRTITKTEKVTLSANGEVPETPVNQRADPEVIEVRKRKIIIGKEEESQGMLEFDVISSEKAYAEDADKNDGTLRKIKDMHTLLKKEDMSDKTIKENIDEFEDVPAFVRKNIQINRSGDKNRSEISKFTLSDDDDGDETKLREDNAYLNDNVD